MLPCEAALYLISCLTANLTARCLLSVTTELLSFISIISHKAIVAFFFFFFGRPTLGSFQVIISPCTEENTHKKKQKHDLSVQERNHFAAESCWWREDPSIPCWFCRMAGLGCFHLQHKCTRVAPEWLGEPWALAAAPWVPHLLLCRDLWFYLGLLWLRRGDLPGFSSNLFRRCSLFFFFLIYLKQSIQSLENKQAA